MRIIFEKEGQPKSQPDPFIFAYGGKYYIYSTGADGVCAYRAERLDGDWEYLGVIYARAGRKQYWAPCVLTEGDAVYLYVSTMPEETEDDHTQCLEVASAPSPEAPFRYLRTLLPPFSIDSHVVRSGGKLYMFYSVNDYDAERSGTYIVVQKMRSPTEMEGEPVAVIRPTLDEEIFLRDRFQKGKHWHTVEGPCYFRDGDDHYLIYSAGCYESAQYFLGYAAAHAKEDDLTKIVFEKKPSDTVYAPLIAKNEEEDGTGHNSVIKIGSDYWCVYHGRDVNEIKNYDNRSARICRLVPKGGELVALR